jgi:hypothetical protein
MLSAAVGVDRVDDVLMERRLEAGEGNEAVGARRLRRSRERDDCGDPGSEKHEHDELAHHGSVLSSIDHVADRR